MKILNIIRGIFNAICKYREMTAAKRRFRRRIEDLQRSAEYYYKNAH